jgi:hypothetical protein
MVCCPSPPHRSVTLEHIYLLPLIRQGVSYVGAQVAHREIVLLAQGREDLYVLANPHILSNVVDGLLKNAVKNTPDERRIEIRVEQTFDRLIIRVQDFGVGITGENKDRIFGGLLHTQEDIDYGSKRPYDFSAGGKGLELFLMTICGQLFGFRLSVGSGHSIYLPTDKDLCPGRISLCRYCGGVHACVASGGSLFFVFFPVAGGYMLQYGSDSANASQGNAKNG